MGMLDSLENFAAQQMGASGNPTAKVAGGLMEALEQHPGGLAGVMDHMSRNGVDPQQVAAQGNATNEQMAQGLQGSPLIDTIAQKTGLSPQMVQIGLATVLPMVMAHFTQGGTQAAPQSGFSGMASQILGKFL